MNLHTCDICRRPRSKEFHRRYPAGQGYPRTHSVCRRCRHKSRDKSCERPVSKERQDQKSKNPLVHIMSTAVVTVKIVCRALMNQHGLDIHVHHHHWYHGNEDKNHCPDQDVEALESTMAQKISHSRGEESITIGEPLAQIAELPDSPAPARCELPAYQESEGDVTPPEVKEKPAFHFRVSDYVT